MKRESGQELTDVTSPSAAGTSAAVAGPSGDVLARAAPAVPPPHFTTGGAGSNPPAESPVGKPPESLLARLMIEQAKDWQFGGCTPVESYVDQHPGLLDDKDGLLDLIYHEVLLRTARAESPQLNEYLGRFPQFTEELRLQFEVHEAMDESAARRIDTPREAPSTGAGRAVTAERSRAHPVITGYEILDEIGRGGMGVVYRARHLGLNRVVALKMVRAGPHAAPEELRRFRGEAELVAGLQHPNITQIYDVGEHEGLPFFSLEYVSGGSLAQRLAGRPQEFRAAAALIETLAHAVHYAHEHGVVHRDLKPANVLLEGPGFRVRGSGEEEIQASAMLRGYALNPEPRTLNPKITDFGLAKRLAPDAALTGSGALIGTPQYMAPEQAAGHSRAIGPATDVYALGVILYEMITGRPPFGTPSIVETLEQVRSQEPVAPGHLIPKLPRDLETICLKCLQKDPAHRYPDAAALAGDLRRYLAGESIVARPVGQAVRLARWCRRKPAIASLAAALVLASLGGVIGIAGQWRRAERNLTDAKQQRSEAEENFLQAWRAVDNYFTQVSESKLLDVPGLQPLRKELLEDALQYYQAFIEKRRDDPKLRAELALSYLRVGMITDEIGSKDQALTVLEEASRLWTDLVDQQPTDASVQAELARTEHRLATVLLSLTRTDEAFELLERSRSRWQALTESQRDNGEFVAGLATAWIERGTVLPLRGAQPEEITEALDTARGLLEGLVRDQPSNSRAQAELARAHGTLGNHYAEVGNLAEALSEHQRALEIREGLVERDPHVTSFQAALARTYANLGSLQRKSERPAAEVIESFQQACDRFEKLALANPTITEFQADLARCYGNLGIAQVAARRPREEVLATYRRGHEIRKRLAAANPGVTQFRAELGRDHNNIGNLLRQSGQPSEALEHFDEARRIYEELAEQFPQEAGGPTESTAPQDYRSDVGLTLNNKALALQDLGTFDEAVACFHSAIEQQRAAFDSSPRVEQYRVFLSNHLGNQAALLRTLGRPAEAAATALERKTLWPNHAKQLYNVACELALCIPLVGKGESEITDEELIRRERFAEEAVAALRDAVRVGYTDRAMIEKDKDLDPIRDRLDFHAVVESISR
jgi:serine/threonine protein kinase/tetratricopeptide (TPR) repeat protein